MKEECEYSNEIPLKNDINVIILPLDGIDQFGYIKHTSISLDKIILNDKDTQDLLNGRPFTANYANGNYLVYGNNEFIGVGIVVDSELKIKAYIKD